jgi:hypothetical protein
MAQQTQVMRFSDSELDIIKGTFLDNYELLIAVRKVMLQMPLGAVDLAILLVFKGKDELNKVMRKTFLPELDSEAPLGQEIDLWMILPIDKMTPTEAYPHLQANKIAIDYIDQQLETLKDTNKVGKIRLSEMVGIKPDETETYINNVARNTIIGFTENQLVQLRTLAEQNRETEEERKLRESKDSNK